MKNLARKVTLATLALMLIGTSAANAVTYGSPQKWQTGGRYCPVMMYADYNWWEELWGKRDGWELQYYAYC